jgi:hypothetical protein
MQFRNSVVRKSVFFALGAVCALAIGGGTAYAANGWSLLIGRGNTATGVTTLANSTGSALSLSPPSGQPPLRVNNTTKIGNLNSDLFDNLDSAAFALKAGRTGVVLGDPDDADGYMNTARCPNGTIATGGGGYATEAHDSLSYTGPDMTNEGSFIPNSWFTVADGDSVAWVVCYNPRGEVAGVGTELRTSATREALQAPGAQKPMP